MTIRGNAVPLRQLPHPSQDDDEFSETDPQQDATYNTSTESQSDTTQQAQEKALNKRVLRKLDTLLLPFLALLFLTNSLDRSNIGAAETAHFTSDLDLPASALNTAVAVFFAFFVLLQPLGAALGRKFGMTRYVPVTMGLWGLCTCAHVLIRREWELVGLRAVIGILEAGFYPTTVGYLSLFYTRWEFGRRLGGFYGMYAVAGAVGGLLSYVVFSGYEEGTAKSGDMSIRGRDKEITGWKSWQTLFLLEGGLTLVIALLGFFWLPKSAGSAWFFSAEEQLWAEERIRRDRDQTTVQPDNRSHAQHRLDIDSNDTEAHGLLSNDNDNDNDITDFKHHSEKPSTTATTDSGLTPQEVLSALTDWKVWYLLLFNILSAIPATAFSIFLPLVLQSFTMGDNSPTNSPSSSSPTSEGFNAGDGQPLNSPLNSAATTNLLTIPPYLLGAVTLYTFSAWSDRTHSRLTPILTSLLLILLGLSTLATLPPSHPYLRYTSLCVLLSGTFIASPLTIAWLSGNIPQTGKRSVVLGINGWGNFAGVLSSWIFSPGFAPGYGVSFLVTMGCVSFAVGGFAGFRVLLGRENERRKAVIRSWSVEDVEMERRFGRGPVAVNKMKKNQRSLAVLVFLARFAGPFRGDVLDFVEDETRSGDQRVTFVYSY